MSQLGSVTWASDRSFLAPGPVPNPGGPGVVQGYVLDRSSTAS
jgi:hypothetical protein